jgi:uncharacterized protein YeaO (DUF488 family)
MIGIKRVYDEPDEAEGLRILGRPIVAFFVEKLTED